MTKKEIEKTKRAYIQWIKDCSKRRCKPFPVTAISDHVVLRGTVQIYWEEDSTPVLNTEIKSLTWAGKNIFVDKYDPACIEILESMPHIKESYAESCKRVRRGIRDIDKFCKKYNIDPREIYK